MKATLTQEDLKANVSYDPETGKFIRLSNGKIAGSLRKDGRFHMEIGKRCYLNSRLAFLWMTGKFPTFLADHINRVRSDDRWANLREATPSQNLHNREMKENSVGVKGVSFDKRCQRYTTHIWVNSKVTRVGGFKSLSDAKEFVELARELCYGEFANNQ